MSARPTPSLRSIATRPEAARVFVRQPSARIIGAAVVSTLVLRARDRRLSPRDGLVVAAVAASQGAHEWVIHRAILHATPRTVRGMYIDPGAGHRAHHDDPDVLDDAMLHPADALRFTAMVAAWVTLLCLPLRRHLAIRHVATAVAAAEVGLLAYEWTHFADHTSVPFRTRRAQQLRAHHRKHHHLDDTRWLGITSASGDRIASALSAARR